jgi:hypothetical protein
MENPLIIHPKLQLKEEIPMDIHAYWPELVTLVNQGLKTNHYVSLATLNPDGTPHITPIGSLMLKEDCQGYFWEEFPQNLPRNLKRSEAVCIMAVNGSKRFWLKSLITGSFKTWPGIRLYGTAGPKRKGTPEELARWRNRVRWAKPLKGYKLLWEQGQWVRDLYFDRFEPVLAGRMSQGTNAFI